MATITGLSDANMMRVNEILTDYERTHPGSLATAYRSNEASIRIRIIDDRFTGLTRSERNTRVWSLLRPQLGDELSQDITVLLLLPTSELRSSIANAVFEAPVSDVA